MTGPHPSVALGRKEVRRALAELDGIGPSAPTGAAPVTVLIGCSGGVDSLALAAVTQWVCSRPGSRWRCEAAVIDHQWHSDSADVTAHVVRQLQQLGYAHVHSQIVQCDGPGGPEAQARRARYAALDSIAAQRAARAIFIGHTADDQAETVLLGLLRGSGPRSLAGMPRVRGNLVRPWLDVSRRDTEAMCAAMGLAAWSDPANDDVRFMRPRVRTQALPELVAALGPGVMAGLRRTARIAAADADYLDAVAEQAAANLPRGDAPGCDVAVSTAHVAQLPEAIRTRVYAHVARSANWVTGEWMFEHVRAIDALIIHWRGQGHTNVPGGRAIWRSRGWLCFGAQAIPSAKTKGITRPSE